MREKYKKALMITCVFIVMNIINLSARKFSAGRPTSLDIRIKKIL